MLIAIRSTVLLDLISDPEYSKRLEEAKTKEKVVQLLRDYCKKNNVRYKDVLL